MSRHYKKLGMVQNENDDIWFPFNTSFSTVPLDYITKARIIPPSLVMAQNYFYGNENALVFNGMMPRPKAAHGKKGSRAFRSENIFEQQIRDLRYFSNFKKVVPNGHFQSSLTPLVLNNIPYDCEPFQQPIVHRLEYEPLLIQPEYVCPDLAQRHIGDSGGVPHDEHLARAFIASTQQQFIVETGHTEQIELDHECYYLDFEDFAQAERSEREIMRVHQHPYCTRNSGIHTQVSTLNLHEKSLHDDSDYIHAYVVSYALQRSNEVGDHMTEIGKAMGHENEVTAGVINNTHLADEETGVVLVDAALQMSLSLDDAKDVQNNPYPYLENSARFQKKKDDFSQRKHIG